ncbi:glycosyltransferase [bacterium]|nr:glycosyltransferase [bacterium]
MTDTRPHHGDSTQSSILDPQSSLKGHDIVCVASSNWDGLWVNAQHLMSRLAERNRVLYVENMGLRAPAATGGDLAKIVRRVRTWMAGARPVTPNLHALAPIALPFHQFKSVRAINRWLLVRRIRRHARRLGMTRPILWSFLPTADSLVGALGEKLVVYQCVDDYAANPGAPFVAIREAEARMVDKADLVIATSPVLYDRLKDRARRCLYSPNAANAEHFANPPTALPDGVAHLARGRRVIGYAGNISAYKTDIALLTKVARAFPDDLVLLVGPIGVGDPTTNVGDLLAQPNVRSPGRADYDDLPAIVSAFDVAILPLADNESTRASFPMKFYEYMAAGKPIVATELPSFADYADRPDLVRLARGADAFVTAVRDALAHPGDERVVQTRREEARRHDWTARVLAIGRETNDALARRAPRVALVHDWLTGMRGGEKVLEVFGELWPSADLLTLLHIPGKVSKTIENRRIKTSFVQRLPFSESKYRNYLPLFPFAIERFDMSPYDVVISSSHCVAKSVKVRPGALHISYVHTPMRYVWDMYDAYFGPERIPFAPARWAIGLVAAWLRRWDATTADRVHHFVSNSRHVAERIRRCYGREATVIWPPADIARFAIRKTPGRDYLIVSALVPYKRIDLAVRAAAIAGFGLKIVGTGPEMERLKAMAGPNVTFLGWQSDEALPALYANGRAFLFPGEEDFGITPLEAQASGRPVIAYARGGALETVRGVRPGEAIPKDATGVFFDEPNVESLIGAIAFFEANESAFDPEAIRANALPFARDRFRDQFRAFVEAKMHERGMIVDTAARAAS